MIRREWMFATGLLVVAGVMFVAATLTGHRLLNSGYYWPPDVLFGLDIARNIDNVTLAGFNDRSNVHPLYAPLLKPPGRAIVRLGGVTPGMAAVMLNAGLGALALLLAGVYLRARDVPAPDALALVVLMAGSAAWAFHAALPGTTMVALALIAASAVLLAWTLKRPKAAKREERLREAAWGIAGVLLYGMTVTNGAIAFLLYGFGRRGVKGWLRAAAYGAIVLAAGLALTVAFGSMLNLEHERRWIYTGGAGEHSVASRLAHSVASFLAWAMAAPWPTVTVTTDERAWSLLSFQRWQYAAWGWALVAAWVALLAAGLRACARERDPLERRHTLALAAGLAFSIVLHTFYYVDYEGVFEYSPHVIFMLAMLPAPLMRQAQSWRPGKRWMLRAAVLALGAALAVRHIDMALDLPGLVELPEGFR